MNVNENKILKLLNIKKEKKKAPQYFLKMIEKSKKILEKELNKIGISSEWLEMSKKSIIEYVTENHNIIPKEKLYELQLGLVLSEKIKEHAWALFRYKNSTNKFGTAENLELNNKKEEIIIKEDLFYHLNKLLKKRFKA